MTLSCEVFCVCVGVRWLGDKLQQDADHGEQKVEPASTLVPELLSLAAGPQTGAVENEYEML